jgi:hypothetical protein
MAFLCSTSPLSTSCLDYLAYGISKEIENIRNIKKAS